MDTLKDTLLTTTYTLTTAHHRLGVLRHVLEVVFFAGASDASTEERYQAALSELSAADRQALEALGTDWLADITQDTLHATLSDLRTWLEEIPTMTLYVPVVFAEEQVVELGQWCRAEIADPLLLELVVEPATVGGCAFIHNHTYHDLSLRARLAEAPDTVPSILATYESA